MPSPTQGVEEWNVGGLFELRGGGGSVNAYLINLLGNHLYFETGIKISDLAHHKGQTNLRLK